MKTLIENSIKFKGIGHPDTKTIFNIENDSEKDDLRYKSLIKISGRKLVVNFDYSEDDNTKTDKFLITVIKSESEDEIKSYILDEINNFLS
jgi:hypothetical protein